MLKGWEFRIFEVPGGTAADFPTRANQRLKARRDVDVTPQRLPHKRGADGTPSLVQAANPISHPLPPDAIVRATNAKEGIAIDVELAYPGERRCVCTGISIRRIVPLAPTGRRAIQVKKQDALVGMVPSELKGPHFPNDVQPLALTPRDAARLPLTSIAAAAIAYRLSGDHPETVKVPKGNPDKGLSWWKELAAFYNEQRMLGASPEKEIAKRKKVSHSIASTNGFM